MEQRIKAKIEAVGVPLKDWDINIYRGILTGFNEAFIIDENKRNEILANCKTDKERQKTDELIRPLLRGRDIKRYSYDFADLYLICTFPSKSYNIDEFPAVKKFLEGFKSKLEQTGKKLTKSEIYNVTEYAKSQGIEIKEKSLEKSRKKTNNKWFETQDSISYWEEFSKQKIVWKAVGRNLAFSILEENTFLTAPASFITSECNFYLLGFLCSSFAKYFIYNNSDTTGAGDIMLNIQSLIKIPIPQIENKTEIENLVSEIVISKKEKKNTEKLERELNNIIYLIFKFDNEEINFIENI